MKILLDECVPKRIKAHLKNHELFTARELDLGGVKNGELLKYCCAHDFDILLTIDKNMIHQQNLDKYPLTIAVLNSRSSDIKELLLFLPNFMDQMDHFKKHRAYFIDK